VGRELIKLSIALIFAMLAAVSGVTAQTYPSRPVTVIVPFAAGGVTDIVARIVSERMNKALGQSVIIENVSGAGGTIGVTRLFRARPTATPSSSDNGRPTSAQGRCIPCPSTI
jgi:putative tricarboxylic transport membrane protein